MTDTSQAAGLHEHKFQGQTLRHAHLGGDRPHGYYEHPEDGGPRKSGTPLADALALVEAAQGNDIETERRLVSLSFTDPAAARELAALRELAEVVRVQLLAHPEGQVVPGLYAPPF